ncbi:MAG: AAA family ATPase [Lachnospiraceae bacterium]|nr:AAA family ATPase [Lachnospiraceae bacterium]
MINQVKVFWGSKKDFNAFLEKENLDDLGDGTPFMELIQHYNSRIRPSEAGVKEVQLSKKIQYAYCICRADDYSSVLPHVLSNFVSIVCLNHDLDVLYVHNPPRKVLESLESFYEDDIQVDHSEYLVPSVDLLRTTHQNLLSDVLGQTESKKAIISGLYRLMRQKANKPVVIMLYGPSGVGKTETAKSISRTFGGKIQRIQFSMMQNQEAMDYVFGSEHSKVSLARDLLARETNIVLIDEFDKVHPTFYNAFYEVFDEGHLVDTNYDVDLGNAVFLLTSNYMSEEEIKKALGPAMFSRIGCCVKYEDLTAEEKQTIVLNWYEDITKDLIKDEKNYIDRTSIRNWFLENAGRYDNIRILKNKLEKAIYDSLTDKFIFRDN